MTTKATIKIVSKNKKGVEKLMKRTKPGAIKVGILTGVGVHPNADDGQTVAEIGAINEFGTSDGRIPERPFMRNTFGGKNNHIYTLVLDELLGKMLEGEISVKQAQGILGLKAEGDLKAELVSLSEPANAPATLEKKAPKTDPLIDTGHLHQSIAWGEA